VAEDPADARRHAELALTAFREAARRALKRVAEEKITRRDAMKSLRRLYERLCETFLRASADTTYAMWCELVKPEWDELVAAAGDVLEWATLSEEYERRHHG